MNTIFFVVIQNRMAQQSNLESIIADVSSASIFKTDVKGRISFF
jgi:hypothetical protein